MDGWMDGRTDGRTDGWMDGWMDGSQDAQDPMRGWVGSRTTIKCAEMHIRIAGDRWTVTVRG